MKKALGVYLSFFEFMIWRTQRTGPGGQGRGKQKSGAGRWDGGETGEAAADCGAFKDTQRARQVSS